MAGWPECKQQQQQQQFSGRSGAVRLEVTRPQNITDHSLRKETLLLQGINRGEGVWGHRQRILTTPGLTSGEQHHREEEVARSGPRGRIFKLNAEKVVLNQELSAFSIHTIYLYLYLLKEHDNLFSVRLCIKQVLPWSLNCRGKTQDRKHTDTHALIAVCTICQNVVCAFCTFCRRQKKRSAWSLIGGAKKTSKSPFRSKTTLVEMSTQWA